MYSGPNYNDLYQGYYPYVQPYQIPQLSSVYINRNFQPIKPPTVHVNPNFKRQIHINPNFQNANIHVNPSILKTSKPQSVITEKTVPNKLPEYTTRTVLATKNKLIRLPENKTLVKSKYKIIRSNKTDDAKGAQFQSSNTNQGFKCDKYKVINNKFKLHNNNKFKLDNRKDIKKVFKSKFKLDRRSNSEKTLKSRFKLIRKSRLMQLDPQKDIIKQRKPNIYKTDNVKLPRTVKIRGRVFKFSSNFEFLHLLHTSPNHYRRLTRIVIRGLVYIQKDGSTYVRSKTERVSQNVKGSLNRVKINQKMLKKDNMPCLIYRKTGKCDLASKGRCFKQHKPEEISICIRFLQGACFKPKCLLSHKVSPDKLPTCKFYLEGSCCKDNCQYLHVKLSRTAEICKDFLQGFCKNGRDCDKRHQFICPDFEKLGKCRKKSCLYPHGNTVRRYKFTLLNKIARSKKVVEKKVRKNDEQVESNVETVRYYLTDCEGETGAEGKSLSERAKLGSLPEFIPLS